MSEAPSLGSIKSNRYTWQYRARERYVVARRLIGRKPPSPEAVPWPPRYIAFTLVGMLGDTLMCLPVLEAAREAWPQARLCAVVTPRIREMRAGAGYVDEFLVGTGDPLSIRGLKQTRQTEERLSERRFDVAILLIGDQYAPLFHKAGVPIRVGPAACVYEPLLTHTYLIIGAAAKTQRRGVERWRLNVPFSIRHSNDTRASL